MQNLHQQERGSAASIVIIGAGPVGLKVSELLLKYNPQFSIVLLGDEPYLPYDRVNLGNILVDDSCLPDHLLFELPPGENVFQIHTSQYVTWIDRERKIVFSTLGRFHYDKLVLATGAKAYVPEIEGRHLKGVLSLRGMQDALAIRAQSREADNIVVLGGGLLGLETAAGLKRKNIQIHIIERNRELRYFQSASVQQQSLQERVIQGLVVHTGVNIQRIEGDGKVRSVLLDNGQQLACDLLIFAVGIRAETTLASAVGLDVNNGIVVDDCLQTSDPDIYAMGDCAEHRGVLYGLIAPGYEQAEIFTRHLSGERLKYNGSNPCPRLKLAKNVAETTKLQSEAGWSEEQLVCDCNAVTCGQIVAAIKEGNDSLDGLRETTGAANNCGACRPLLVELLGKTSKPEPPKSWFFLQVMALATIFTGLVYILLPGFSYQSSIDVVVQWDGLWRDSFSRQVTGFSLLGIAVTVSLISIRKRIKFFRWGSYADWRNAHLILGLLIMVTLLIHTGARPGNNLDAILMLCFVVVLITGGMLTASIANEHKLAPRTARRARLGSLWLHLLTLWPLPALLIFHVLKSYYF